MFILTTAAFAAQLSSTANLEWHGDIAVSVVAGVPHKGEVVGLIDAPVDDVLRTILDCEGFESWFPDMRQVERISSEACRGTMNLPWPLADRTWTIDVGEAVQAESVWRVSFDYVPGSGNLEELHGTFSVAAHQGGTLVHYEAWVDLGCWVPQWAMNWAAQRILPQLIAGLEMQARSSMYRLADAG